MSFVDQCNASRSELIRLVRAKDRGMDAWFYVRVEKSKFQLFLARFKKPFGPLNLEEYGTVLYSGWGKTPPQEIVDKVQAEFG